MFYERDLINSLYSFKIVFLKKKEKKTHQNNYDKYSDPVFSHAIQFHHLECRQARTLDVVSARSETCHCAKGAAANVRRQWHTSRMFSFCLCFSLPFPNRRHSCINSRPSWKEGQVGWSGHLSAGQTPDTCRREARKCGKCQPISGNSRLSDGRIGLSKYIWSDDYRLNSSSSSLDGPLAVSLETKICRRRSRRRVPQKTGKEGNVTQFRLQSLT